MTAAEYNECVESHADGLYRFMLRSVRDRAAAEDLVQDAFERLWLNASKVEWAKARSWLFTVAYRAMVDGFRRQKWAGEADVGAVGGHSEHYSDLNETLHRALEQLPPIQQSVVLLRDYEGYSYAEIGRITGLNEAQVKVYIFRARSYLREYLGSIEQVL